MPILVTKEVTKTLGENLVLAIDSGTTNTKAMLIPLKRLKRSGISFGARTAYLRWTRNPPSPNTTV